MENLTENSQNQQETFYQRENPVEQKLKGTWQLLKDSWHIYRSRFLTFVAIMILPVFLSFIFQGIDVLSLNSQLLSQSFLFSIVKIIIWLFVLYFEIISVLALAYSFENEIGVVKTYLEAIRNSFSYIKTVLYLFSIVAFPILIVSIFFLFTFFNEEFLDFFMSQTPFFADSLSISVKLLSILTFILSFILFVYFSFAVFVFSFENKKGFQAIWKSKDLISGNFWKTIWRFIVFLFFICLIFIIPLAIIEQILNDKYYIITQLSKIFITPFSITFAILLYKNLTAFKINEVEKSGKICKIIGYFSAITTIPMVLAIFVFQCLSLVSYDIPRFNDSDLQLPVLDIPKEKNAYYDFAEASDLVYWPKNDEQAKNMAENKNWNGSMANEILSKNQKALDSFEHGLTLSIYVTPEIEDPANIKADLVFKRMLNIRNVARVNSIEALSLMKQGKDSEAIAQAIKTLKIGKMMQDGRGGAMGYFVGSATKEIGLANIRSIIESSKLSSFDLMNYENELEKYEVDKNSIQNIYRIMYIDSLNNNRQILDGPLQDKRVYWYKANKTQKLFADMTRENIASSSADNYSKVSEDNHAKKIVMTPGIIFTENAIGKIIFSITSVGLDNGLEMRRFQEVFSIRATQIILAMKAYKQDNNGDLPNSLNDLVPKYISDKSIQDPFDGKTIRYSSKDRIIYSVGKDLDDDGGNMGEKWNSGNDLVFKINL